MRNMATAAILMGLAVALAGQAEAQTRLPRKSPTERQVEDINRNIRQGQQQQRVEQQIRVDDSQIRQSIQQQRMFTAPSYPGRGLTCPAGSVGCN
jgi:hypothetical protein